MRKVPLFDVTFDKAEEEAARKTIRSGWLTMGRLSSKFEEAFTKFIGVKHAIAVSNCTAALHLSNIALGISAGDEVIGSALTFVADANSIVYTGAKPVFSDIVSLENLNISPDGIKKKINKKTKAIQVVHYAGYPCDMDKIMKIARMHNLSVIEDCAHAHGAQYRGKKCGSIGDIGCFSFFSNKNMTTAEGGMITTNNDMLAKKIRLMRSHGMTKLSLDRYRGHSFSYDVTELGFNYRIDEIRSAIGMVQLKKLKSNNIKRKKCVDLYHKQLSCVKDITVPFTNNKSQASHHIFPVILSKKVLRKHFMNYMKKHGIETSIHYPAIHLFNFYRRNFGYKTGEVPITEEASRREVSLPLYPSMKKEDIYYICDKIIRYFTKEKGVKT